MSNDTFNQIHGISIDKDPSIIETMDTKAPYFFELMNEATVSGLYHDLSNSMHVDVKIFQPEFRLIILIFLLGIAFHCVLCLCEIK